MSDRTCAVRFFSEVVPSHPFPEEPAFERRLWLPADTSCLDAPSFATVALLILPSYTLYSAARACSPAPSQSSYQKEEWPVRSVPGASRLWPAAKSFVLRPSRWPVSRRSGTITHNGGSCRSRPGLCRHSQRKPL